MSNLLTSYTPKGSEAAKRKMAYLRSLRGRGKPRIDKELMMFRLQDAKYARDRKLREVMNRIKSAKEHAMRKRDYDDDDDFSYLSDEIGEAYPQPIASQIFGSGEQKYRMSPALQEIRKRLHLRGGRYKSLPASYWKHAPSVKDMFKMATHNYESSGNVEPIQDMMEKIRKAKGGKYHHTPLMDVPFHVPTLKELYPTIRGGKYKPLPSSYWKHAPSVKDMFKMATHNYESSGNVEPIQDMMEKIRKSRGGSSAWVKVN